MRRIVLALLVGMVCLPAWASSPGEPLDCEDWAFFEPGLSCHEIGEYPGPNTSPQRPGPNCVVSQDNRATDNGGAILSVRVVETGETCIGNPVTRLDLIRYDGITEQVLARVSSRCLGTKIDRIAAFKGVVGYASSTLIQFDPVTGHLWITAEVYCGGPGCTYASEGWPNAVNPLRVFRIEGFATLFDMVQTYTPEPPTLSFRVPYMPEGMGGADYFDTYYGAVTKPLDLAQAQPLRCGYPETGPGPETGDYLTVADTVPTPAPGHAVYYLTAATYMGETRAGRKADSTGRLSGRDGRVLPECGRDGR